MSQPKTSTNWCTPRARRSKRRLAPLLLLMLLLGLSRATPTAIAQTPGNTPALALRLPWEGAVRTPGWTEVQVALAAGDAAWQGELVITDRQQQLTYRQPINLPASGRQSLRLPLYIAEPGSFTLQLLTPDGAAAATQRLTLQHTPTQARFCVVVDALEQLAPGSENGCDSSLLLANLESLPETAMAWDTIDVLILREVATSALTPAHREALWAWLNLGGQLTLVEGPGTAQTLAGLPQALKTAAQQLAPGTAQAIGVGELARVRPNPAAGNGAAGISTVSNGADAWLGDWHNRPVPAASILSAQLPFNTITPTGDALMQVPRAQIPQLGLLLALLPIYALLIGPGAWWLARRLQRPQLAWLFIPGGILLAALVIWLGITGVVAGAFPLTHEVAVIIGNQSGAPARVLQTTAVFAPRARNLSWSTELAPRPFMGYADTMTSMTTFYSNRPFPAQVVWEGAGGRIAVVQPPGPLTWASEGLMRLPKIEARTSLTYENGRTLLSGSLSSEIELQEVTLIFEDGAHRISIAESVQAGAPVDIALPLEAVEAFEVVYTPFCANLGVGNFYPAIATPMKIAPTTSKTAGQCYLTASTPGVPFPGSDSSANHIAESCLILALPCPTLEGGGIPLLPQLDFESAGYGWLDADGWINFADATPVTLLYTPLRALPEGAGLTDARVTIHLEGIEPLPQFSLEVWDWQAGLWLPQASPTASAPLVLEGRLVRAVLDPTRGMRLRLTSHHNDYVTLDLNVILETQTAP